MPLKDIRYFLRKRLTIFGLSFCLYACNNPQTKFAKDKWNEQSDPLFPSAHRKEMLDDLTANHKMVGLKYNHLIDLLGVPDYKDKNSLSYKIIVDYGGDTDPIYTKNLELTFSKDSLVTAFRIVEWKK